MELLSAQLTEVDEALKAASRAKSTVASAMDSLDSAEGWATYDLWSRGGLLSHAAKYSHIDDAEACFHRLSSQMRSLRSELDDVQGFPDVEFASISSGQRSVDFWFDNIFTDLSVRSQIRDNQDSLRQLAGNIHKIERLLDSRRQELSCQLDKNKSLQEELLLSF